jgi:hypothetical protein
MEFQMRNKTFISSMVGIAAAVAVCAGPANASITQVYNQAAIATQTGSGYFSWNELGGEYSEMSNGMVGVSDNYLSSNGSTGWAITVDSTSDGYAGWLLEPSQGFPPNQLVMNNDVYDANAPSIVKLSFRNIVNPTPLGAVGTYIQPSAYAEGPSIAKMSAYNNLNVLIGFVTVDFAQNEGPKFIGLESSSLDIAYITFEATSERGSIFSISGVSMVPAPGALGLLGAAGLAGARRRRA